MTDYLLQMNGLSKKFGGLLAVDGVDLTIRSKEVVGVIGPNGAGKTTLFNLMTGFERPSGGSIHFEGEDVTGLPAYSIAQRGLSRTFQIVRPFPGLTVLENLIVGGLDNRIINSGRELEQARTRALEIAELIGLSRWLDRQATTLPHGSLKRLEIGRVIMGTPKLLLLDEPFAGLGGQEVEDVATLIEDLARNGISLVIIEHKLRVLMRLVERVVVLNFGKSIADGPPSLVSADEAVREAYLGTKGAGHFD